MIYVHLVTVLALFQLMVFATLVGRARGTYGINAPATTAAVTSPIECPISAQGSA